MLWIGYNFQHFIKFLFQNHFPLKQKSQLKTALSHIQKTDESIFKTMHYKKFYSQNKMYLKKAQTIRRSGGEGRRKKKKKRKGT